MLCGPVWAGTLRLGLFHSELERDAPGLLYRDILRAAPDVVEAVQRIVAAQADILVLLGFDYDADGVALAALARAIQVAGGPAYDTRFALRPNTGWATGLDLNRDGVLGTPQDAQGYGEFAGQGGMAILSTYPVVQKGVQDFSTVLWSDLPWASLPELNGKPFLTPAARQIQRLSTTGHWIVPVDLGQGNILHLLVYHAGPPVFDGPEDRNGLRSADETAFWTHYLTDTDITRFAIVGDANLDPDAGEGRRDAIKALLSHPKLQDPFPAATKTVDWSDIDLGLRRTDYILPSQTLTVSGTGTLWPNGPAPKASRHALIWVDLAGSW